MERRFAVIIERDPDGYYVATVPALKGCYAQAKSKDELDKRIKEVIQLCLEQEQDYNYIPLECVGCEFVCVWKRFPKI